MDKLKMQSENLVDSNIDKIAAVFPNCVTEGKNEQGEIVRVVDFDLLKQELSKDIVEGTDERYTLNWAGKKQSILTANSPIAKTLRPCKEESVDFDSTQNLYIEGDNLDVLKLLRETYLNKVKMIYIDPPYNTGNDFVYEDDFADDADSYLEKSKSFDEQGNRLFQNNDSNGRFHSDWLSMMFSRLRLAKDLLTDDGVIFISIGQDEIANLRKLCGEVFGAENFCGIVSRLMKSGGAKGRFFSPNVEYILVFAKNTQEIKNFREIISDEIVRKLYTSIETEGKRKGEYYRPFGLYQSSLDERPNQRYFIEAPDGSLLIPPGKTMPKIKFDGEKVIPTKGDGCWRWSRDRYLQEKANGNIVFKKSEKVLIDSNGAPANWNVYTKIWLSDRQEEGLVPVDLITKWENRFATKELQELDIPFDFAKPSELIKYLINIIGSSNDSIILDFFSGSATTAHAVMQLNAEDGGNRKFIMVQLPEKTDEASEAYMAGYKNICKIGKERIRRAGNKIKAENQMTAPNLDVGFRVLKLDTTCMKDVYYSPSEISQDLLSKYESNIKEDRSPEDLLFQVMLDMGVLLSSTIEVINYKCKMLNGGEKDIKIFNVNDNNLICCFNPNLTDEVVTQIAKLNPLYSVFRDSSMSSDSTAVNFDQIFATYSPATTRRVI